MGVNLEGWPPFPDRLWQRGFYDHVILNPEDLDRVRRYIIENPGRWIDEWENPAHDSQIDDYPQGPTHVSARVTKTTGDQIRRPFTLGSW